MGAPEVEAFLSDLATGGKVAPSTQNQAKAALLFLYKAVLGRELPWLDGVVRRHFLYPESVQKAIRLAAQRADIAKPVSPHVLRLTIATHLLAAGYDIRTIQEFLGHKDVSTTMIHTHVLNRGGLAVTSPLDRM